MKQQNEHLTLFDIWNFGLVCMIFDNILGNLISCACGFDQNEESAIKPDVFRPILKMRCKYINIYLKKESMTEDTDGEWSKKQNIDKEIEILLRK